MNYVTAVVMQFTTKNAETVIVKARGKFISMAVDVAEVATKRFLEGQAEISSITTNSEEFTTPEGKQVRVSSIEITIGRKPAAWFLGAYPVQQRGDKREHPDVENNVGYDKQGASSRIAAQQKIAGNNDVIVDNGQDYARGSNAVCLVEHIISLVFRELVY
mgnify:CR=1 FL=1